MKKKATYLVAIKFVLGLLLLVPLAPVYAGLLADEEPIPSPTPVCQYNANSVEDGEQFYFPDDGECLAEPIAQVITEMTDGRVPTSVKLVSTSTEIRDPVSTVGIIVIFLLLVALTLFWLATIKKWDRSPK